MSLVNIIKSAFKKKDFTESENNNIVYIVYNVFDIDSILGTAVLMDNLKELGNKVTAVPNTAILPTAAVRSTIYLLGVDLTCKYNDPNYIFKETEKISVKAYYRYDNNIPVVQTIFQQICEKYSVTTYGLEKDIELFNSPKILKRSLIRLYANWIKAIQVIAGVTEFEIKPYTESWEPIFNRFIEGVKNKLNNHYNIQLVEVYTGVYKKTALTCFSGEESPWLLRLVRLAHVNYANICTSLNGTLIETNIDISNLTIDNKITSARHI